MKNYDRSFQYKLRLLWEYKDLLRNHFPPVTKRFVKYFAKCQQKAAFRLQGKETIDVAFFLTTPGMWKVDSLFSAMLKDPHYHPYVVIYPYSFYKGFSSEEVMQMLSRTEQFISAKGYEYKIPYDASRNRWLDPKNMYHPDIVFFTTPYKDFPHTYYVYHYRNCLTCYVPYSFTTMNLVQANYNLIFHNLVGIHFLETEIHRQTAERVARNGGKNLVVSGYPGTEIFLRKDYQPKDVWKHQTHPKKKVIWAPHHSIDGGMLSSSFLIFCDIMLEIAQKYQDQIQIVFKPHQLLKFKLQQLWGTERTKQYYDKWNGFENTQLEETSYIDYFFSSDAMIHDSGSFTTEYIFLNKPVMFLGVPDMDMESEFCPFGIESYRKHYHGSSKEDIERFIVDVVITENDTMFDAREQMINRYLLPPDGKFASEKIIDFIEKKIAIG